VPSGGKRARGSAPVLSLFFPRVPSRGPGLLGVSTCMSLTIRCVVQRHLTVRGASAWRHRTSPVGGLLRTRAMAAQPGIASTTRKLHELNVDQSFVRELPGDPLTENSLRQACPRFLLLPRLAPLQRVCLAGFVRRVGLRRRGHSCPRAYAHWMHQPAVPHAPCLRR
jgi:hypothetical protein